MFPIIEKTRMLSHFEWYKVKLQKIVGQLLYNNGPKKGVYESIFFQNYYIFLNIFIMIKNKSIQKKHKYLNSRKFQTIVPYLGVFRNYKKIYKIAKKNKIGNSFGNIKKVFSISIFLFGSFKYYFPKNLLQ